MSNQTVGERRDELFRKTLGGDADAKDEFVKMNLPLVWSMVKRFAGRGHEQEDLFQIGSIGLIKAIEKFDASFGVKFSTYAVPMIMGEIKRFLRDDGMIKVSRSIKDLARQAAAERDRLSKLSGRDVTISEVAKSLGVCEDDIVMAFSAMTPHESIQSNIYSDGDSEVTLADTLHNEKNEEEEIINEIAVSQLLKTLNEREKLIIQMRYFNRVTQSKVAQRLGISQVQISRMEKKILEKLRNEMMLNQTRGM